MVFQTVLFWLPAEISRESLQTYPPADPPADPRARRVHPPARLAMHRRARRGLLGRALLAVLRRPAKAAHRGRPHGPHAQCTDRRPTPGSRNPLLWARKRRWPDGVTLSSSSRVGALASRLSSWSHPVLTAYAHPGAHTARPRARGAQPKSEACQTKNKGRHDLLSSLFISFYCGV